MSTRTHVVIVRHVLEAPRTSNTGRLAALALVSSELHDYGRRGVSLPADALTAPGTWLLYPDGPTVVPERPPERPVVLDATWSQARRMLHRIPQCRGLPRLSLPALDPPRPSLRRPRAAWQLSTLQAIIRALDLLEGAGVVEPLERLHALLFERSGRRMRPIRRT